MQYFNHAFALPHEVQLYVDSQALSGLTSGAYLLQIVQQHLQDLHQHNPPVVVGELSVRCQITVRKSPDRGGSPQLSQLLLQEEQIAIFLAQLDVSSML